MKTILLTSLLFFIYTLSTTAQVKVCTGSSKTYWIDPIDSLVYEWSLKNACGKITSGQGSNKITVLWNKESCSDSVMLKVIGQNICNSEQQAFLHVQTSTGSTASISGSQTVCMHHSKAINPIVVKLTGIAPFTFSYSDGKKDSLISNISQKSFEIHPKLPILEASTYRLKQAHDSANCSPASLQGEAVLKIDPEMGPHLQLLTRDTILCPTDPHIALKMNISGSAPFTVRYQMGAKEDSIQSDKNMLSLPFEVLQAHNLFQISCIQDQNGCICQPQQSISIDLEAPLLHQSINRKKE